jgi:signal transduction histidine kinase
MPTDDNTGRGDRLLQKMDRVFSHDLPNQIVALESLLQMLEHDESGRLSDAGRDYVGRLQQVGRDAAAMVAFLRELGRLRAYRRHVANVALATVLRDVQAALHEDLLDTPLQCELGGDVPAVSADPKLLSRALIELLRCLLERAPARRSRLRLTARRQDDAVELRGDLSWPAGAHAPRLRLEQRPEIVLAEEFLAAWNARLCEIRETSEQSLFIVHVPL